MSDFHVHSRKPPRKILGGSEILDHHRTTVPSVSSARDLNLYSAALQQQQQQQMDRIRLANMMSQEMHTLWPYGTATFLSGPLLPAHNMAALPYALAGALPYTAMPFYPPTGLQNPQQQQTQQQQQQQQCAANMSPGNNNNNLDRLISFVSTNGGSSVLSAPVAAPSTSSSSGGSSSSAASSRMATANNDSNKINIQIGVQSVNQNTPINFNTLNDVNAALGKVNLLNFCGSGVGTGLDKECKDSSSSLRSSPILLSPDSDFASGINGIGAGGDGALSSNSPSSAGGSVTLSQAKFSELTRLALRGSEIAEKLAYTHRNRPCFKKIDSLCARMKQDLIRPDGVLPNINSQGIAWAVKDFIFVFTRVINAWIIIKGYVYNTPDGLNKVKAALSPDFAASFVTWQDTTLDFVENLIKSFVNLDNMVQSQKNVYQKTDNTAGIGLAARTTSASTPIKLLQPVPSLLDDSFDFLNQSMEKTQPNLLNKNYLYTMVEDSEGSQRQATANGTYFKTGTYNPIKKENILLTHERPLSVPAKATTPVLASPTAVAAAAAHPLLAASNCPSTSVVDNYFEEQIANNEFWSPGEVVDPTSAAAAVAAVEFLKIKEKIPPNWLNYDIRVLVHNLTEFSSDYDPTGPPQPLGKDLIDKLNMMIERLMAMKHAELFFKTQFTKNYFPVFFSQHRHDFMDVRSIILKCQVGGYQHIFEVVHDVRCIMRTAREFLKLNMDSSLQKAISAFEVEFDKLLSEPPFENYHFDHITGEPNEILYNNRKK